MTIPENFLQDNSFIYPNKNCFFDEGYEANKDEYDLRDNPYREGSDGYHGWRLGWNAAERNETDRDFDGILGEG